MSEGFVFRDEFFTDEELYRRIGFVGVPSDRELEARIIALMRQFHKSGNMELYDFFDAVYDYFFESGEVGEVVDEGFQNAEPTPPSSGGGGGGGGSGEIIKPPEKNSATYLSNPVQFSKDNTGLNPILKQTISRLVSIDSSYRDINASNSTTNAISTNFVIDLNDPLKDVLSLKLYSYQIPFTWYTVSKDYGSNFFLLQGVSPGLSDTESFTYKYDISAGNYSAQELVDTINTRMRQVASANTDVSFGSTSLVYNKYNTRATFNVEMTNIYGESNYYLDWVATASTPTLRDSYIGSYLGFRESSYGIYSIYSNEDSLLPIATTATADAFSSIYYLANRTDFSNNYFKVVHYYNSPLTDSNGISYVPRYTEGVSQVLDTFLIQSSLTTGKYTRNAIYADIEAQLQTSGFLASGAGITRVDRTDASYSYFRMDLPLNRSTTTNMANSKVTVVFPNEPSVDFSGGTFPVWTGLTSCFLFDPSFVETSDLVSETSLNLSNYLIVATPVLDLSCNVSGYVNPLNQALIEVAPAPNPAVGYTFSEYIAAINTGFDSLVSSGSLNINSGIVVDASNFANLSFDYNLSFVNADYTIDLSGGLQLINFGPVFTSVADLGVVSTFTNTLPFRTSYSIAVDSFGVPLYPLFTVSPKAGRGNENAGDFVVPFLPASGVNASGFYVYNSYLGFLTDYNNSINQFADAYGSQVFGGSLFNIVPSGVSGYTMTLQMNVFKSISQNGFNLSLYDLSGSTQVFGPYSSWYNYLHFQSREYVLSSVVQSPPSSVVVADLPIEDTTGTITLVDGSNNYFYFRPQTWADGLWTSSAGAVRGSAYNDVRVVVPAGTYTTLQLFTAMNTAFNANPVMQGTYVDALNVDGLSYTRLRVNLNKIFTAADYELVFYDLFNFVQCYVGSSSVRNTTWDTTLGWILGFQAQTSYSLAGMTGVATLSGESSVNVNLYSYFLISLEDYNQSRINDGLVTITKSENYTPLPSYSAIANFTCDLGGNAISTGSTVVAQNNLTLNQVYAINQSLASQQPVSKSFSQGPYVKDLFAMIPIKTAGLQNGQLLTEYGGSLQNLTRFYYGPVNIRRLQVQLYNNQGQIMDLNGSDWSFSFICEQLYQKNKI